MEDEHDIVQGHEPFAQERNVETNTTNQQNNTNSIILDLGDDEANVLDSTVQLDSTTTNPMMKNSNNTEEQEEEEQPIDEGSSILPDAAQKTKVYDQQQDEEEKRTETPLPQEQQEKLPSPTTSPRQTRISPPRIIEKTKTEDDQSNQNQTTNNNDVKSLSFYSPSSTFRKSATATASSHHHHHHHQSSGISLIAGSPLLSSKSSGFPVSAFEASFKQGTLGTSTVLGDTALYGNNRRGSASGGSLSARHSVKYPHATYQGQKMNKVPLRNSGVPPIMDLDYHRVAGVKANLEGAGSVSPSLSPPGPSWKNLEMPSRARALASCPGGKSSS